MGIKLWQDDEPQKEEHPGGQLLSDVLSDYPEPPRKPLVKSRHLEDYEQQIEEHIQEQNADKSV